MSTSGPATDGYLLDLNILRAWQNTAHCDHPKVLAKMRALGNAPPVFISAIAAGEIEFGHRVSDASWKAANAEFQRFIDEQFPSALEIRRSTAEHYGEIKSRLFDRFAPRDQTGQRRKHIRVAQLIDPLTDHALGVDENDVWSAAQALEYNLVLVTHGKMTRVCEVTQGLLRIENWRA